MTADTYSNTLGYLIMGTGNDNNVWGANANASVFQIFEDAIANALSNAVTGGTLDLSGSPPPAAASQARYAALIFTGVLGSNQIVQVPNLSKFWWVKNATSGAFTLKFQTPAATVSTAIPQNSGWQLIYCDGSNNIVVSPFNSASIQMPDGSLTAPAYSNITEPTSGLRRAGTADWRLSILGVDIVQFTGATASTPSVVNVMAGSLQQGGVGVVPNWVAAGGTADAITATYSPAVSALTDGLLCFFRAAAANATTTPTFAPNGLTAHTITKVGGSALIAGDIPAALAECILRYNLASTRWELLNPAPVIYTPAPQGRLTPVSGSAVITSDATSVASVFYTPYAGNLCPVFDGNVMVQKSFAEQTLTLVSNHLANTIYDVFAFMNGSTFTIGTGPAFANSAAGSGSRGTGAGTTQLAFKNGLLTNAVAITARNGSSTFSVGVNQATYLGSIFIDSVAGQITCHVSYGQSRKWAVWNAYNPVEIVLQGGDPTATWNYSTDTWRASNGSSANSVTPFCGVAVTPIDIDFVQTMLATVGATAGSVANPKNGIGFNSTTSPSGKFGQTYMGNGASPASVLTSQNDGVARYEAPPSVGINVATCLERGTVTGNATDSFLGSSSNMMITARWMG